MSGGLEAAFAAAMAGLGPFEAHPFLTVAVSGGADSMALALLTQNWLAGDGRLRGLVVDHALRPESPHEALVTVERLGSLGIAAKVLPLTSLHMGSALAERARIARYQLLSAACQAMGSLHLLLGHHAGDQAETMAMRALTHSQTHGLAAMPALRERATVRLLRPLLTVHPGLLRDFLRTRGVSWTEDPSNHDFRALRPRVRHRLAPRLTAPALLDLTAASAVIGDRRRQDEAAIAAELASRAVIRPEGFAVVSPGRIGIGAMSRLLRTIGGSAYAPSLAQVSELAADPRPATLAGVRLLQAGATHGGLLMIREEAAISDPIPVSATATWDRRFRIVVHKAPPEGAVVAKLGHAAASFRRQSDLPSAVLRTLPAVWSGGKLQAVPHLGYADSRNSGRIAVLFNPPEPCAGQIFTPA